MDAESAGRRRTALPPILKYAGSRPSTVEIPEEIDDHYRMYGKHPWEVEYGEKCGLCGSREDEFGFCSCGASGE